MDEISLNILDIAKNSIRAKAALIEIMLTESDDTLSFIIKDDGIGMDSATLTSVKEPFFTTKPDGKGGLGIPALIEDTERTGGQVCIESTTESDTEKGHGTAVSGLFYKNHKDCAPLGDIISTLVTLIQGHPDVDICFFHKVKGGEVSLDTREIRKVLGAVPLDTYEILLWIRENLKEQYLSI